MNTPDAINRRAISTIVTTVLAWLSLFGNTYAQEATWLEPGRAVTPRVKANDVHSYQLTFTAGQFMHIMVEQNELDVSVSLLAPNQKLLHEVNFTRSFGIESLSWDVTTSGTHQLIIRTLATARAEGSYRVECKLKDAATTQDKQRLAAERLLTEAQSKKPKRLPQQVEKYQQALQRWRSLGETERAATTLELLSDVYFQAKQYQLALAHLKQALADRITSADHNGTINLLNRLADYTRSQWQNTDHINRNSPLLQQARAYHEQALTLARTQHLRAAERYTLSQLVTHYSYRNENDGEKELVYQQQILTLDRANGQPSDEAKTMFAIGYSYENLDRYEKAIEWFEAALLLALTTDNPETQAYCLYELGQCYVWMGHYEKAMPYFEKALPLWRAVKNHNREAVTLVSMSNLHLTLSHTDKARGYVEQALTIARQTKDRRVEGIALRGLCSNQYLRGNNSKAEASCEQASSIFRVLRERFFEGTVLSDLGNILSQQGNFARSSAYFEQSLKIMREEKVGLMEGAISIDYAMTLRARKQLAKATILDQQAWQLARRLNARDQEAGALSGLMMDWKARQQPALAIYFGKQAVSLYQDIRSGLRTLEQDLQRSFRQAKSTTYRELADLLIAQGRLPEAEQVIRLLKEEEYFEYVRRNQDNAPKGEKVALTPAEQALEKRYREIADQLTVMGTQRGELLAKAARTPAEEQRLAQLEADLTVANQIFQKFLNGIAVEMGKQSDARARVFQLREAQGMMEDLRELGTGTVAVYTLVGANKYRVILTTAQVQRGFEYPIKAAALNRKVLAFRDVLQNPRLDPLPLAQELYKILVAPLAKDLQALRAVTVMWSLDGILRYVPIAALHDGEKYLVERFRNVVFTPASTARIKDEPSRAWRVLGLGVTKSWGKRLPALPGVAEEMRGLIREEGNDSQGILPGTIHLDEQFTRETMLTGLRQRPPVVHVASHFQFQPGNETDSALLLGDGQFLSLEQIKTLPNVFSGVELLTLSACNTALGSEGSRNANGVEVEGFGVLAQRQGAKAIVASLWPVADRSTKTLMLEFYQRREAQRLLPKAEAIRQAQIKLLQGELPIQGNALATREIVHETDKYRNLPKFKIDPQAPYAHPYYWAPFILIGNWK